MLRRFRHNGPPHLSVLHKISTSRLNQLHSFGIVLHGNFKPSNMHPRLFPRKETTRREWWNWSISGFVRPLEMEELHSSVYSQERRIDVSQRPDRKVLFYLVLRFFSRVHLWIWLYPFENNRIANDVQMRWSQKMMICPCGVELMLLMGMSGLYSIPWPLILRES